MHWPEIFNSLEKPIMNVLPHLTLKLFCTIISETMTFNISGQGKKEKKSEKPDFADIFTDYNVG